MSDILSLLASYSAAVAVLLALAAAALFVLKLVVERAVASGFDARAKMLELGLQRRSAFEEKVLTERFALVTDLSARLQRLMTDHNRIRSGQPVPEGFYSGGEVVPLTRIYEDLEIHRLVLTEEFHGLFLEKANLARRTIDTDDPQEYERLKQQWVRSNDEVRAHAEKVFGIGRIHQ